MSGDGSAGKCTGQQSEQRGICDGSGLQGGSIVEGLTGQASGGRDLPSERAELLRSEVPGKGTRRVRTQAFQSGQWVTL